MNNHCFHSLGFQISYVSYLQAHTGALNPRPETSNPKSQRRTAGSSHSSPNHDGLKDLGRLRPNNLSWNPSGLRVSLARARESARHAGSPGDRRRGLGALRRGGLETWRGDGRRADMAVSVIRGHHHHGGCPTIRGLLFGRVPDSGKL